MNAVQNGSAPFPDSGEAKALLERARTHFTEGRLEASEAASRQLSVFPGFAADGFYGLGMVSLRRGNFEEARSYFSTALRLKPENVNALFQLGVLAERRGAAAEALDSFRRVAAISPQHAGARRKLASQGAAPSVRTAQPSLPSEGRDAGVDGERLGVYEFALYNQPTSTRSTLKLINDLQKINVRPTLTSYLGRFVFLGVIFAFPLFLLLAVRLRGEELLIVGGMALLGVALAFRLLLIALTTRLTVEKGRLQIRKGVLLRTLTNVELWRVRDVQLNRGLFNQLTRDGTLVFYVQGETPVRVPGLARGRELEKLYQDPLNLVFVLRSNPVVKGIIS